MGNSFIVLEGIDGSGKTTIAGILSEELGCHYYKTPSPPFDEIRRSVDEKCPCPARFFFYLSSVLHASKEIRHLLQSNHVVCDRYLYSTLAYHYAADDSLKRINLDSLDILKPDFHFYLSASFKERTKRISQRESEIKSIVGFEKLNNESFQSSVEKEFHSFRELHIINTENLSISDVLSSIKLKIERCLNG